MTRRRSRSGLTAVVVTLLALIVGVGAAPPAALAAAAPCAPTAANPAPGSPGAGTPCWTDVQPYPFGSDGNPVNPTEALCAEQFLNGPNWVGDFNGNGGNVAGNPPCYLQVSSMSFRAWNRGLAATGLPLTGGNPASVGFGVWLYNGTNWFPDPTFPGAAVCPGSTVLWAGKLDYWLVGSSTTPQTTLCRFDGVNLVWEPLSMPAATLARLPLDPTTNTPRGGITSGACYAWNNCWFFGTDGIMVHWDGQVLSDESGLDSSPWLQGDFTGAIARTDPSGAEFGVAVTKSSVSEPNSVQPLPAQPDGSEPPQLFGSEGGAFAPLAFSPPATPQPSDPFTTDLVALDGDARGDVWVAGDPSPREPHPAGPAPLMPVTRAGAAAPCSGYDASTFTVDLSGPTAVSYEWTALSVFPNDGSALAGLSYRANGVSPAPGLSGDVEPGVVQAACGQSPLTTLFRIPDPRSSNPSTAPAVPADEAGFTTAVASLADNDAWVASSSGSLPLTSSAGTLGADTRPHLYLWTDGQSPNAPAGDDVESRPQIFVLDPPVYNVQPPPVQQPPTKHVVKHRGRRRVVHLKPAIYDVQSKLRRNPNGSYTLYISFKVRRPVTLGLEALKGGTIVANTGLIHFTGHTGTLTVVLYRQRWPSRLTFITPKPPKRRHHG